MKLTIIFLGLIAHFQVQNGAVERAVLVYEPHHDAVMEIATTDLVDRNQVKTFVNGKFVMDGSVEYAQWDLSSLHLEFHNLPPGATNVDPQIPSLKYITNGTKPLTKVLSGVKHSHTTAYVDYSGGDLVAVYTCDVMWTPPRPPVQNCQPQATGTSGTTTPITGYTGDTSQSTPPYIMSGADRLDLVPTATVWISNSSQKGYYGPHHKEYLWLLDDGDCISEMKIACARSFARGSFSLPSAKTAPARATTMTIPGILLHFLDLTNPECTNSRFP